MKVIAFDIFNTVVNFIGVPHAEKKAYADHIRQPMWQPLVLPASWERLPAFPDSAEGIRRLREKFLVVTLSNGSLGLQTKLLKNAGVTFDAIIPLELARVFKPQPEAYLALCDILSVQPTDVMMVTTNRTFGDIEASQALGMQAVLIRESVRWGGGPKTIIELADQMLS